MTVADKEAGLEERYTVYRNGDTTGKHDACRYFVLDPQHDPIAMEALVVYAILAEAQGFENLSEDIRLWVSTLREGVL